MLQEIIKSRRTVRKFKNQEVDRKTLEELLMYSTMGPSNGNSHPVEFIIVDDKDKIEKLSEMESFATLYLKECPCIIIVMANTEICKTWVEECSIAASYLQLLAKEQGLGTAWINVKEGTTSQKIEFEEYFRNEFNIPKKYRALCLIPIGYPKGGTKDHETYDVSEKIHYNTF